MTTTSIYIGMLAGAFGAGYFVYGKREQKIIPLMSGIILCIYPYFTDNIYILVGAGIFLVVTPFFLRF